jgi:hypothetical protein
MADHLAVSGPSGGGKTTLLREIHDRFDGASIFLTTKGNERTAEKEGEARQRKSSCSYPDDIRKARRWARDQNIPVQVIVDEAHNAPSFQSGEGPLSAGIREDRSRGIRYVVATQNPQAFNNDRDGYGLIQQCDYWVFVGPAKDWHVGFFRANNMSGLEEELPTTDYRYVVIEPIAAYSAEEKIVATGRTSTQYG